MCDCRKDLEEKLTDRFVENAPTATDHSVTLQGYGFAIVDNKMLCVPYMEASATAVYPLKNGGTKKKTLKQNMFFSFCPFCGAKATEAQ